jgi:ATP-binding cassette subfamily F protein uup
VRQNAAKLSYKEQRELDQLPARIEALEEEQSRLQQTTADPAFYRGDAAGVSEAMEQLRVLAARLEADYRRWDELENLRQREA